MSSAHTNYRLDEAQAIMSELRTIKKAICTGEKERQDLMQVKKKIHNSWNVQYISISLSVVVLGFPGLNKEAWSPNLNSIWWLLMVDYSKEVDMEPYVHSIHNMSLFHIFVVNNILFLTLRSVFLFKIAFHCCCVRDSYEIIMLCLKTKMRPTVFIFHFV